MTSNWRRRLKLAIAGLLAAAAVAIPALQPADAQTPPVVESLVIVNEDEEQPFVERKKHGEFRARPIFNLRLSRLTYGIRDADPGEWLTAIYRVNGGEDERDEGWEYDFDYPALDEQPDLDPEQRYLLAIAAQAVAHATPTTFYVTIPEHQPGGIFNKIVGAGGGGLGDRGCVRTLVRRAGTVCGRRPRAVRGVGADVGHHHRHTGRPHLRTRAGPRGVAGRLDHHLGRAGADHRLDRAVAD